MAFMFRRFADLSVRLSNAVAGRLRPDVPGRVAHSDGQSRTVFADVKVVVITANFSGGLHVRCDFEIRKLRQALGKHGELELTRFFEFLRAAEMFGASRVLQKPIEAENLLQAVRAILPSTAPRS